MPPRSLVPLFEQRKPLLLIDSQLLAFPTADNLTDNLTTDQGNSTPLSVTLAALAQTHTVISNDFSKEAVSKYTLQDTPQN